MAVAGAVVAPLLVLPSLLLRLQVQLPRGGGSVDTKPTPLSLQAPQTGKLEFY